MLVCDICKELNGISRHIPVSKYTFGLHSDNGPLEGIYASFRIDICDSCIEDVKSGKDGYTILNCWKKLTKQENK